MNIRSVLSLLLLPAAWAIPVAASNSPKVAISYETVAGVKTYHLDWFGTDERIYFVKQSENLMEWTFAPIYGVGEDAALTTTVTSNADRIFFRLAHENDPESELLSTDYNGARLSAWEQIQLGYNPFLWTDPGDNDLHDAWEEHYFGSIGVDPLSAAPGEGLSMADVFALGGDPTVDEAADASLREDFTYDDRGWMLSADVPSGSTVQFSHDDEGNILQVQ